MKQRYSMVVTDIDDTLLRDDLTISDATKRTLAKAYDEGIIVTLATGRMFASARQIAKQLDINVPLITYQGSLVKNLLDEKVLYERFVPESAAETIYAYCTEHDLHLQAYVRDTLYCMEENDKIKRYAAMSNVTYRVEPDFHSLLEQPITKLLIYDEPEKIDRLLPEVKVAVADVHITKSKPYFLEILHREGTKGHALACLADHFHIPLSEVIAVGDSWNDREMIEKAGLGVAVENAVDTLKELADYVTKSNNEDGVKHIFDRFIF